MKPTTHKKEHNNDKELDKCRAQSEEYLQGWKRAQADFLNYKKDESRRTQEAILFANENLVLELIDILDNLRMTVEHAPPNLQEKHSAWLAGLKGTHEQCTGFLKKYGVERILVNNEFDPTQHEAIEGSIGEGNVEEIKAGYTMHGKVIRPARVLIK